MNHEVAAYRKHKNLKIAAAELGVAWQSLYVRLKKLGEPITGDKLRYGTDRDKLGALGEAEFKRLVPFAVNANDTKFQAKYDFDVAGHKVDIKASMPRQLNKRYAALAWSFSFKKQIMVCDFICCICFEKDKSISHILVVPHEFFNGLQTVSVSRNGGSKWLDYSIPADEISAFFASLPAKKEQS